MKNKIALIAENEAPLRYVLSLIFQNLRVEVVEAASAEQAIRLFNESPGKFDFILTNLEMEDKMAGIRLGEAVRMKSKTIPIFLVSGNLTEEAIEAAKRVSIDGAFEKPYSISDIKLWFRL